MNLGDSTFAFLNVMSGTPYARLRPDNARPWSLSQEIALSLANQSLPQFLRCAQGTFDRINGRCHQWALARMAPAMAGSGRTFSTAHSFMASLGIPKTTQVASS